MRSVCFGQCDIMGGLASSKGFKALVRGDTLGYFKSRDKAIVGVGLQLVSPLEWHLSSHHGAFWTPNKRLACKMLFATGPGSG